MAQVKKNMIIAQSGGPTAVINASVVGAFQAALETEEIKEIYGANNGIEGVLKEELIDLKEQEKGVIEGIKLTPSSALGSCRYKLSPDLEHEDYKRIFQVFKAHNVGYFFYNGGNDSMDTAYKLNKYAQELGYDIKIIGIPKTIDNDLKGTDNCPGYGSAAKYINTSILDAAFDCHTYSLKTIVLVEVMGRHAGWLAASGALATYEGKVIADLIYLPEVPFSVDKFLDEIKGVMSKKEIVFAVISEGIKNEKGEFLLAEQGHHDTFGHKQLGGVSNYLEEVIQEKITKRVKVINPGILQRSAATAVSKIDLEQAYQVGYQAVKFAADGHSGYMTGIKRITNHPYQWEIELVPLEEVAGKEKKFPLEWVNKAGNFVTKEAIDYMQPLIQGDVQKKEEEGLPRYYTLNKEFITKKL